MSSVFIVGARRTPFGTFGGKLKSWTATDLAVHASKAALANGKVDPSIVNTVVFGNVAQTSTDAAYLARHVGLRADVPIPAAALTLNRLCGSGFQAIVSAAHEIKLGESSVGLVGGTESMSQAPLALYGQNVRFANKLLGKDLQLQDTLWSALTDSYIKLPMAITAENLAEKYGITREDCDEFAARSQATWGVAAQAGVFADEIEPIEIKSRKGTEIFDLDEHPRPGTSVESLAKLPPVFKKDGTVTAGNASGICDGAAALVVAGEEAVKQHGLTPLARIVSYGVAGVDPSVMGIGPVPAIHLALERAGLTLGDMSLVEVNEAFAAQFLAVEKELGIDRSIANVNGGAIALGHPLGCTGARMTATLFNALKKRGGTYGVVSMCIGTGMGAAAVFSRE